METQPPIAQSFTHEGKTYTIEPKTLTGENVEHMNAAVHRSRTQKAMAALPDVLKAIKEATVGEDPPEEPIRALAVLKDELLAPVREFVPIGINQLGHCIKHDPIVTAEVLLRCSPEVRTREEAEKIVRTHPVYHELSMRCFVASGVAEVGKSSVLRAILPQQKTDSSGSDPASSAGPRERPA